MELCIAEYAFASETVGLSKVMPHEHDYSPPLEFDWIEPEEGRAFVLDLPQPPSGQLQDQAFFYRLASGEVVGYFNRCSHVRVPLDFDDRRFLDLSGMIVCRVHGARYDLATGDSLIGPATFGLAKIRLSMDGNKIRILGWERGRRG